MLVSFPVLLELIWTRYPTFIDALRDIDDALCVIFLFASLPPQHQLSGSLIENCVRLAAEWQLIVMRTRSLRKVFLSIKGIYYQAEFMDQNVTWIVPYQFTQTVTINFHFTHYPHIRLTRGPQVPPDVDLRVMMTFLELYQTLLGFVFFKLYTDAGLVYPPPLDTKKDDGAGGVDAFALQDAGEHSLSPLANTKAVVVAGKTVSSKDVRQNIKSIASEFTEPTDVDMAAPANEGESMDADEEFVHQPSTAHPEESSSLPTLRDIAALPTTLNASLFAPYTFFLSREVSRSVFEFVIRSFGGKVGWPPSSGTGSPFDEIHESITHIIIDRPIVKKLNETEEERERRLQRKYVQPQWVVDCINAGKILLEEPYAQGQPLPPHLSPFGEREGAYNPVTALNGEEEVIGELNEEEEDETEVEVEEKELGEVRPDKAALKAAARISVNDPSSLRNAELAAEIAGMDYGAFENEVRKSRKKSTKLTDIDGDGEQDMNKMMMSNKQRKLYTRLKYSQQKRAQEVYLECLYGIIVIDLLRCRKRNWNKGNKRSKRRREEKRSRLWAKRDITVVVSTFSGFHQSKAAKRPLSFSPQQDNSKKCIVYGTLVQQKLSSRLFFFFNWLNPT
jgi:pescadillo